MVKTDCFSSIQHHIFELFEHFCAATSFFSLSFQTCEWAAGTLSCSPLYAFSTVLLRSYASSPVRSNTSPSVFLAPSAEPTDVPASVSSSCFSTAALGPDSSSWIEAMRNGAAEDCLCPTASSVRTNQFQVEAVGFPLHVPSLDLLKLKSHYREKSGPRLVFLANRIRICWLNVTTVMVWTILLPVGNKLTCVLFIDHLII